jgi:hypothetical protein
VRKITIISIALAMVASVSPKSRAADDATKVETRARGHLRPLLLATDRTTVGSRSMFCHYLGGPHGTSWVCS